MTLHLVNEAAKDGSGASISGGARFNDESGTGAGPVDQVAVLIDSTQKEILGTQADAKNAATDTTQVSAMSVWKQISASIQAVATAIAGTLTATVSGTVTANAGTNMSTAALAVETGGNLAAAKADLDTIAGAVSGSKVATKAASGDFADGAIATIGAKTDAKNVATDATSVSGISIWKQISASIQAAAATLAGTLTASVSGSVTANAGTNLNTSLLAVETGGNLAAAKADLDTIAGAVSGSKVATKAASGDFADGAVATIGAKADAKNSATDTTAVSGISIWKQISFSIQAAAASLAGTLAVSASQTGSWVLSAGSALIGIVKIGDGTNTAAVKAASTAPVATDPAVVVAISPNSVNANGQALMASSAPVTLASDQKYQTGMSPKAFSAAFTTLTRPANTTAYTAGNSISNNATAGSVTALSATVSDTNNDLITITDILIASTDTGLAGKRIRAYLFNSDPTANTGVGAGNGAAYSQKQAGYIGSFSGILETGFSDGTVGRLVPTFNDGASSGANSPAGGFVVAPPASGARTLYIQYQAIDAFTPSANSTTIIGTARGFQGRAS